MADVKNIIIYAEKKKKSNSPSIFETFYSLYFKIKTGSFVFYMT